MNGTIGNPNNAHFISTRDQSHTKSETKHSQTKSDTVKRQAQTKQLLTGSKTWTTTHVEHIISEETKHARAGSPYKTGNPDKLGNARPISLLDPG